MPLVFGAGIPTQMRSLSSYALPKYGSNACIENKVNIPHTITGGNDSTITNVSRISNKLQNNLGGSIFFGTPNNTPIVMNQYFRYEGFPGGSGKPPRN
jgi:hypothetical protein